MRQRLPCDRDAGLRANVGVTPVGRPPTTALYNQAGNHFTWASRIAAMPTICQRYRSQTLGSRNCTMLRRQPAFADVPVTQFPPVVHGRAKNNVDYFDSRRFFAFQNTKCHFGTLIPQFLSLHQRAADDASARFIIAHLKIGIDATSRMLSSAHIL